MALNAGSAYSEYRLRYDGFLQDLRAVERAYAQFAQQVERGQPPTLAPDTRGAREAAQLAKLNASIAAQQARAAESQARASATAAQGQARLTVAQNAGAISAQRLATEQQRTATATSNAAAAAARAQVAQLRLSQQQDRASQSVRRSADGMAILPRTIAGLSDEAAGFARSLVSVSAGLTALSVAGQTVVQGFQLKAALDASRVSLGAFLGSQERANAAMQAGERFAQQYALRQTEVASALQSIAPLLRTSTTETEKQLEVLARLQSLNPAATFQDAAFSIKELASGDYASIADQFNLGNRAARALRDEVASGVDVFVALDRVLAQNGATVDVLTARTEGMAGAQNRATAATEQFSLAVGNLVAGPGTALLNWFALGTQGATDFINRLSGQGNAATQSAAQIAAAATSYQAYLQQLGQANAATGAAILQTQQLSGLFGPLGGLFSGLAGAVLGYTHQTTALSQTQQQYVRILAAQGVAADQAVARAQAQTNALATLETVFTTTGGALDTYRERLVSVAAASDGNLAAVERLLERYAAGEISIIQLVTGLQGLEDATRRAADAKLLDAGATDELAAANQLAAASMDLAALAAGAEEDALGDAAAAAFEAANAGGDLEDQARAAAEALVGAGNAGAAAAARLAASSSQVDVMTAALYRQEAAALAARAALGGGGALANIGRNVARGVGGATEAIRALNRVYNAGPLGQPPPRGSGGRGGGGGGGGSSAAVKAAQKQNTELARLAEQREQLAIETQRRLEELERSHTERLLAIQAEYTRKQLEAEKKLRVGSLKSRASFYDALTQSTPDIGQAAAENLSAAYEAAFAEAQKLAQEGKAALAAEFLQLRQQQIQEELEFQKAVAAAREKGNEGEVDRLQRIEELNKKAREEELKQLLEGGDQNVNARQEQLDAENQAYLDKQAEIGLANDEKALKLTQNEAKILGAVQATNLAYAEQLRLQKESAALALPTARPTLPEAQAQAAAAALPPAGAALPTAAGGGAVPVEYPALFAEVVTLGATVARLAGVVEGHSGLLGQLLGAEQETARALERLGVRGT